MGVPVISVVGDHHMSRVGQSRLKCLGLEFFAAATPDEYIAKATSLAAKPESLATIRATIRQRMATSDLCNRDRLTRNMECAYRQMWRRWCESQGNNDSVEVESSEEKKESLKVL